MATILQMVFSDAFSYNRIFCTEIKISLGSNWQYPSIGLDNSLATNKQHAIIWPNAEPIHWRKYLSLDKDELTHCGLVTPFGGRDLGQHLFREWLVAWRHQAITWTNVDLSSLRPSDVHLRAISLEILQPSVTKISFKIIFQTFYWNLPGANELRGRMDRLSDNRQTVPCHNMTRL